MARTRKAPEEPEIKASIDSATGIPLLRRQIEKLQDLLAQDLNDWSSHTAWNNTTRDYLVKIFGSKSPNVNAVIHASSSVSMHMRMSDYEIKKYRKSLIENQIKMLESCIEQLETEIELRRSAETIQQENIVSTEVSDEVFIVHGHNQDIKEKIANLISKLELNPIILHEKPNLGRTLIEKFTEHSNVGFAIVLLTGNDLGKGKDETDFKDRARQNVIFELGYFIGKLGRSKVCALYEEGVELPSDYQGIVYIPLDSAEKWKYDLVREIKASGYNVDANKIF